MKNIILISGHPDISQSTANRLILEELLADKRITFSDIKQNYPDYKIDIAKEQQLLLSADLIILQSPFIWYGLPAHMKLWIENVFSYGFAHGPGGDKLKDKSFLLSLTLGGSKESYSHTGQHQYPVEDFIKPIELLVRYCGLNYLPPVYSYNMSSGAGSERSLIEARSVLQAKQIKERILKYTQPV
jgi:glutathione-regulated potassium-efflux system ancillary protein KefF